MIYSREEILAARAEMPKAWKRTARWRMGSEIDAVETSEAVGLSNGGFDWSSQTALGSSANDFDRQALAFARKQVEARLGGRAKRLHGVSTVSLMGKMGAMVNGVPTHGALLLLGKASSDAHLGGLAPRIVLTRYDDNGHLFQKMNVRMPFALSIQRLVDVLCGKGGYPEYAVRELLTNALAHNDYLLRGNIEITDRRGTLTIKNHGTWAKGTPAGALRDDFDSAPMRNPALCRLMVQCGVMDALGVGLFSVQAQLRAHGLPAITFDLGEDTVTAHLYASHEAEQTGQTLPPLPHTVAVAQATGDVNVAAGASDTAETATGEGADPAASAGIGKPSPAADEDGENGANQDDSDTEAGPGTATEGDAAEADTAEAEVSGESLFFAQAWGVDPAAIAKQRTAEAAAEKQAEAEAAEKNEKEASAAAGENGKPGADDASAKEAVGKQGADDAPEDGNSAQNHGAVKAAADRTGKADAPKADAALDGAPPTDDAAPAQGKENQAESDAPSSQTDKAVGSDRNEADGFTDVIVLRSSEDVSSDELKRLIVPILAKGDGMTRSEVVKALRDSGIQAEDSKFARRVGRLLDQLHKAGAIRKGNPDKRHWYAA